MRLPVTLSLYIGRQFLIGMGIVSGVVAALIVMIDAVELIRRSYSKNVPISIIIEMVLLKLPSMLQEVIPFAILLGGILTFSRLTRTYELIVARAAGVSVWQFLMPALIVSFSLGVFIITTFNPLAAAVYSRFEKLETKYISGSQKMLAVSSSGLWLQEQYPNKERSVIHASKVSPDNELVDVTIFIFGEANSFSRRIDAKKARLEEGQWQLTDVTLTAPEKIAEHLPLYQLPTILKLDQLQDSFSSPETVSFWELPGFIKTLQETGFSALKHRLHWHSILVSPVLFCTMVFIAAAFSLRPPRQGKTGLLMASGIMVGFFIYYMTGVVSALGKSGTMPVILAAWAPVAISIVISMALMLHLEDG